MPSQSQRSSQRSRSSISSQESDSQSTYQSGRVWVPSGHNDQASPRSQAWRDTPPSSQQYSNWNRDQRQRYREEVARNAASSLQTENEVARGAERYWRDRYLDLTVRTSRPPNAPYLRREEPEEEPPCPIRVAAIRSARTLNSQGSTRASSSQDSWSQETDEQRGNSQRRPN